MAQEADSAMLEKDIENETKRLDKAVEKFNKYKTKLRSLEAKLNTSDIRISNKESLKSEIKNLEENELAATTQDIKDIKHRLSNNRIKKIAAAKPTDDSGGVSMQLPMETKEEYLIRTGKVTAFGSTNAFIQHRDIDYKAPTHRDRSSINVRNSLSSVLSDDDNAMANSTGIKKKLRLSVRDKNNRQSLDSVGNIISRYNTNYDDRSSTN